MGLLMGPLARFFPPAPAAGRAGDPGLFGPGSAAWRVGRERLLLAGGPAALLLQVAHPLVAQGVADHSDFTGDPLRRLHGTLDAVLTVTFGDTEQVRDAARRVAARHRPVAGELPEAAATLPAGTPYRASDGDLALWVLTTLVWSAVAATEAFARRLTAAEKDAYLRDMTVFGRYFGVPAGATPSSFAALEAYVDDQVRGVLAVGPRGRAIAGQVLAPDPPLLPRPLRSVPALLAAGLLPAPVREAYGLPWRRRERTAFALLRAAVRAALPLLPPVARFWPHHRVASERLTRPGRSGARA